MLEIIAVARAWGISKEILPNEAVEDGLKMLVANFGSSTSAAFKPSMLLDFEAHKPLELEAIIGSLISRGKAKNAPTSRLEASYDSLIGYQMFTLQAMRNGV